MWWSTQPGRGTDAATFRAMSEDALRRHLLEFHAGWHDPIPRLLEAAENIGVTATLDVATLPTWSRKRVVLIGDAAHATSPHAGQGASLALEDAMRLVRLLQEGQELGASFEAFERERRPRAERVVAFARRNGNQKGEFSATGAWLRDRMLRVLIPLSARYQDWMYAYDPRAA
jgi:2-polyprenyl-6-methoxyphenol hydroxylase-like FAD-dependent oxidoreductase